MKRTIEVYEVTEVETEDPAKPDVNADEIFDVCLFHINREGRYFLAKVTDHHIPEGVKIRKLNPIGKKDKHDIAHVLEHINPIVEDDES